jgi:hypothetical protein
MLINYYYGQKMMDYKMSRKIFSLLILYAALTLTSSGYPQNSGIALSSDNVEINFDVLGDGKPALVFVHGWSNDRSIWDSQISYFSKKYKVVAVDLPGFGKSGNNRRNWTVPAFGGDVAAVIEKLDLDNVVLVGFSLGGPVVIETENKIPDRISGVVIVEALHDVEQYYTPETIKLMDSVYLDLVTNPSMEKLKPFFRKNKEQSFERVLSMIDRSRIGWKESLDNSFLWGNKNRNELLKNHPNKKICSNLKAKDYRRFRSCSNVMLENSTGCLKSVYMNLLAVNYVKQRPVSYSTMQLNSLFIFHILMF